jgi:hypothetical protein
MITVYNSLEKGLVFYIKCKLMAITKGSNKDLMPSVIMKGCKTLSIY